MLFLLFQIGTDRYAIEAQRVVEVIPMVSLKPIPRAARGIAGLFNYRGQAVPALDLSELTTGQPATERLSTRILIVRTRASAEPTPLLGLIAEHATTVLRKEPSDFIQPGLPPGSVPYLGPILMDEHGVIQWIQEQKLLPEELQRLLFAPAPAATNAPN